MAGKYDVYIFEVGGEYRVRPAVVMTECSKAGAPKSLNFRNLTGYQAFLAFPPNFLANNQEFIPLASKATIPANLAQGLDGHYQYTVVINKNGELVPANGESAPSVIVDP